MRPRQVFITGASTGIGAGLSLALASSGAVVYAAARREELVRTLASSVALPGRIVPVPLDVRDTSAVVETARRIDDEAGGLDLVIANAGVNHACAGGVLCWDKDVSAILQTNLMGAIATLTAVVPRMVRRERGHLVGISSLAAYRGMPKNAAYSASKAALSTFLESLRVDLAKTNVKVTSIHPGFIKTPLTEKNAFEMPFLLELDEAVSIIMEGIERGRARIDFPWPLSMMARVLRALPDGLFFRIAQKIRR